MKPGIKERYSGRILDEACHRLGLNPAEDHLLGGFDSFVFRAGTTAAGTVIGCTSTGGLIGLMHRVSKSYGLRAGIVARPAWDAQRRSTERDASVQEKLSSARAAIHTLGTNPSNYHMIHQDPHLGNLHVDAAGSITLFDFDDCA